MDRELDNFLSDLIVLIQEKYKETLESKQNESVVDNNFRLGANFAYYDVLDLIHSQLIAFGFEPPSNSDIVPPLNKK